MDERKRWSATEIVVGQKIISRELYEAHVLELTRALYSVFANQTQNPNEKTSGADRNLPEAA